jgi:hypothetical protein
VRSGVDEKQMFDPFGEAEESAPSASPAPFATDDRPSSSDPFADLNDPDPFGPGVDAARSALFGITPPTASPGPPPLPPEARPLTSGLELSSPPPAPTPSQVPVAAPAPRVSTRIIEAIAGVLQVVLIVGVTVLAVVVGRGGSVAGLLLLDPTQALALPTPDAETGLRIDDVRVSRRVSAAGMPLLLISGVVHHRGEQPFPAVTVEADIDGVVARGQAWTAVTPSAIEAARTAEDVAVLQSLRSQSPTVSPGERAPFVIVVAAPEGFARPRLSARPAG